MKRCARNGIKTRSAAWTPLSVHFLDHLSKEDKETLRRLIDVAIAVALELRQKCLPPLQARSWSELMQRIARRANGDLKHIYRSANTSWEELPEWTLQFTFDYWANTYYDINMVGPLVITLDKDALQRGVFIQWR